MDFPPLFSEARGPRRVRMFAIADVITNHVKLSDWDLILSSLVLYAIDMSAGEGGDDGILIHTGFVEDDEAVQMALEEGLSAEFVTMMIACRQGGAYWVRLHNAGFEIPSLHKFDW